MNGIFHIDGTVKHYDWGGFQRIPDLLNKTNEAHIPFAEYWLGTHPLGHAKVRDSSGEFDMLGLITGPLPYPLKVLDVKDMLSIQVHPSKSAAEAEFWRENREGVSIDAPHRNYKDDNHKPELMVALSDFWLLHGFKPVEAMHDILINVPALRFLQPVFDHQGYAGLYRTVMEMPQEEVNKQLQPLLDEILPLYAAGQLDKSTEDFWAARAAVLFNSPGQTDRGIFSIYLFNLLQLKKGEGIFQDAGLPHAYLEGQNVEIMANSDNVLRGGLTRKHIDVPELLKHVVTEATYPEILTGRLAENGERFYDSPAQEFCLSLFECKPGETKEFKTTEPDILLITEGVITATVSRIPLDMGPGEIAAIVLPGQTCHLQAGEEAWVFRASKPVHSGE